MRSRQMRILEKWGDLAEKIFKTYGNRDDYDDKYFPIVARCIRLQRKAIRRLSRPYRYKKLTANLKWHVKWMIRSSINSRKFDRFLDKWRREHPGLEQDNE